jgi:hypothetical protein
MSGNVMHLSGRAGFLLREIDDLRQRLIEMGSMLSISGA